MIDQYLNCHQGRASAGHLGIEEEDTFVGMNIFRKCKVMEFRFAGGVVRLDQDTTGPAVRDRLAECGLKCRTASKNNYSADLSLGSQTVIPVTRWCFHNKAAEMHIVQSSGSLLVSKKQ